MNKNHKNFCPRKCVEEKLFEECYICGTKENRAWEE